MDSTVTRTGMGHPRVANPKVVEARETLRSATGTISPRIVARVDMEIEKARKVEKERRKAR